MPAPPIRSQPAQARGLPKWASMTLGIALIAAVALPAAWWVNRPEKAAQPVDVEDVDLAAILSDYKANEVKANREWKGAWVRFSGRVMTFNDGMFGVSVGVGRPSDAFIPSASCGTDGRTAAKLTKGDKVTVTGRVAGCTLGIVQLKECRFD